MVSISDAFSEAVRLVASADRDLIEIVGLSLKVSLSAVTLAAMIGVPLGALLAISKFPGRTIANITINALMGLPPVVVGLLVYLLISAQGPLGPLQLLYTPTAMIIAQAILVTPILAALTRQTVSELHSEYHEQLHALGVGPFQAAATLMYEGRFSLLTSLLAGFGRAISEVGAILIVGGNINHVTRSMTTAIALETSKGELALAIGLGLILIAIAILVNAAVMALASARTRMSYA